MTHATVPDTARPATRTGRDVALDLVIRGGRVVTAGTEQIADVGVLDGQVVQIGRGVEAGAEEIDATGKLVIPGGIDMHVHLTPVELPGSGLPWVDDFESGSRAAAAGGVTTVGNISFPRVGEGLWSLVERSAADAARQSVIDFCIHPVLLEPTPENLAQIPELAAAGHSSIKIFMILGDFDARAVDYMKAMKQAADQRMITLIHCEDACVIGYLVQDLIAAGKGAPQNYAKSRPVFAESVAVERAVAFCEATGAPIYIVHLSSADALAAATRARGKGLPVYVETRPIYLTFTEERFDGPDAGLYVGNPPLRAAGDQRALWTGLATGQIQTCCTDHAPWTKEMKLEEGLDISTVRPGMADLELLMPLLWSEGVRGGRISMQRFVEITSTNAARLFGLYPRKGTIAVGGDADLVIWDPELTRTVRGEDMFSQAKFSLLEGREMVGGPTHTISRGELVFAGGDVVARPGRGRLALRGPAGVI